MSADDDLAGVPLGTPRLAGLLLSAIAVRLAADAVRAFVTGAPTSGLSGDPSTGTAAAPG